MAKETWRPSKGRPLEAAKSVSKCQFRREGEMERREMAGKRDRMRGRGQEGEGEKEKKRVRQENCPSQVRSSLDQKWVQ